MSNNITTITAGSINGITAGQHHGLKTTITSANAIGHSGQVLTVGHGTALNNGFTLTQPGITTKNFKAGTVTIKGEGNEEAEFDAEFINELKLLLEIIKDLPDEHPMGDLKHDLRMRRAFKRLGG
jgi:hypothetical protein